MPAWPSKRCPVEGSSITASGVNKVNAASVSKALVAAISASAAGRRLLAVIASTPVLPALEDEFEAVSVRVPDLRRVNSGDRNEALGQVDGSRYGRPPE